MRVIKFRGKVKGTCKNPNGLWVFGFPYNEENRWAICYDFTGGFGQGRQKIESVVSESVSEFTGRFDKNEKEIYEGDILKTTIDIGDGERNIFYQKVVWKPGGFILQDVNDESDTIYFGDFLFHTIEVVGNEFENPELLCGVAKADA